MGKQMTTHIPGPWLAETNVCEDAVERGLAVIAVIPGISRCDGYETPTRGMVAWVHSGTGACKTDAEAVATANLIAAAPDLLASLEAMVDRWEPDCVGTDRRMWEDAREAIAKAEGTSR